MMKKIFYLILITLFALSSCGRKGPLTYEGEQKRPKFNDFSDETTKKLQNAPNRPPRVAQ